MGAENTKGPLREKIPVTAGPTMEAIDPVRYISTNPPAEWVMLAEAARSRGAEVTLISGPVALECSPEIRRIDVRTTREMLAACEEAFEDADAVVKSSGSGGFLCSQCLSAQEEETGRRAGTETRGKSGYSQDAGAEERQTRFGGVCCGNPKSGGIREKRRSRRRIWI